MSVKILNENPNELYNITTKYVSRNFDILAVLNGTANEGSANSYSVKYSVLGVYNTSIPTNLAITCTHQNNVLKNANHNIIDTLMMRERVFPTWPQINSEITLEPYETFTMAGNFLTKKRYPLKVNFLVNS